MKAIMTLVKRNTILFFSDKTAVFFSFMAVFVVIGLYVSFLGDMMIGPLKENFPKSAREISDTWIMAGTLGIVSLTTSLSVLGIVIEDKSKAILNDFMIAPISRIQISISYIVSTILITFLISLVTLVVAEFYIVAYGGSWMSFMTLIKVFGCMILTILLCTAMLYFCMSFFQSATSFSNVTTIIGTLSGFLMGIYVPVGALPSFLQTIIAYFPPSHGAALFRNIMMEDVLQRSFEGAPAQALIDFKHQFGLSFNYQNFTSTVSVNIIVLITMGFFFLCVINLKRRMK